MFRLISGRVHSRCLEQDGKMDGKDKLTDRCHSLYQFSPTAITIFSNFLFLFGRKFPCNACRCQDRKVGFVGRRRHNPDFETHGSVDSGADKTPLLAPQKTSLPNRRP